MLPVYPSLGSVIAIMSVFSAQRLVPLRTRQSIHIRRTSCLWMVCVCLAVMTLPGCALLGIPSERLQNTEYLSADGQPSNCVSEVSAKKAVDLQGFCHRCQAFSVSGTNASRCPRQLLFHGFIQYLLGRCSLRLLQRDSCFGIAKHLLIFKIPLLSLSSRHIA